MIRPAIRLLFALAAGVAALATAFALRVHYAGWPLIAIVAILSALGAAFSGRAEKVTLESAVANMKRFRTATMVCFTSAVGLLIFCTALSDPNSNFVQSAASLGSALWLVGFGLLLCAAYFRARVRAITPR